MTGDVDQGLVDGVRAVLADIVGHRPRDVRLKPIVGGASRQTFLVEGGSRSYVLRRDPPGGSSFAGLVREADAVAAARAAGVPVPAVLRVEPEGGPFVTAGLLMEHVGGTSVAPRILRRPELEAARSELPGQLAAALARIHAARIPDEAPAAGDPALEACTVWEAQLDEVGEPLPATEAGLRWLRLNAPPPRPATLVHGDFRLGNLIVDETGLRAVIDWELSHAGDPAEDIAWLCLRAWRFGNDDLPVAGVGELEPFLASYEAAGGDRPDPATLRWWEALGNVKWAVICARQAHDHRTGARRSHELASLGRRICEPEWDLLRLIGADAGTVG